jgi:hypothetical protein
MTGPTWSSLPSSPKSPYRASSIFDRVDSGFDSSRPTSPDSSGFESPNIFTFHRKGFSDVSFHSLSSPADQLETIPPLSPDCRHSAPTAIINMLPSKPKSLEAEDATGEWSLAGFLQPPILEEREEPPGVNRGCSEAELGYHPLADDAEDSPALRGHHLRRSTSHESLLSVCGMDIHKLRNRPSQLLGRYSSFTARIPTHVASTGTILSSSPPVISPTNIMATVASVGCDTTTNSTPFALLSSVAAANPVSGTSNPASLSPRTQQTNTFLHIQAASLGKRLGGWVLGKWGMAPVASPEDPGMRHSTQSSISSSSPPLATFLPPPSTESVVIMARAPGVNQKGPIPGLRPPGKPPSAVHANAVDERLLQESLLE